MYVYSVKLVVDPCIKEKMIKSAFTQSQISLLSTIIVVITLCRILVSISSAPVV